MAESRIVTLSVVVSLSGGHRPLVTALPNLKSNEFDHQSCAVADVPSR